ncbi:MAG: DNA polymerase III subunit alpha [SAR324 cluster bacterium]|nr:DNA polymerase III subunit alpha [SAR324 cluster bacterium]
MSNKKLVHLHLHTQYSLLEGAIHLSNLADCLVSKDMSACAITDHSNMHGVIEFYQKMKKSSIKPIIGQGFYIESFFNQDNKDYKSDIFKINIICYDQLGYHNLIKLSSLSYQNIINNNTPTISYNQLKKHSGGLLVMLPGIESELGSLIKGDGTKDISALSDWYRHNFADKSFLDIYPLAENGVCQINQKIYDFGINHNWQMFISNNCLYLDKSTAYSQYILTLIGKQQKISQEETLPFKDGSYYLASYQEMLEKFGDWPSSVVEGLIAQTSEIADMTNINLTGNSYLLPDFKAPDDVSLDEFFKKETAQGLNLKFEKLCTSYNWKDELKEKKLSIYQERLDYEIGVISKMDYIGYFMIVADFVGWAKNNDVLVGPGRGSGAGSLVAYSLDITDIDPIKYDLLFERFLNPARVSMPDFDIDFEPQGRERVIEYIRQRYGNSRVAQIATIGTLQAKAVIRSVARVLNIDYSRADKIAKLIPNQLNINLTTALEESADLSQIRQQGNEVERNLIKISLDLEGLKSNLSTHAAGVVIMRDKISDIVPICLSTDQKYWQTQYQMDDLETQGAVKFDLLGLRNLSTIKKTISLIAKGEKGTKLDLSKISLEDKKTYQFLSRGFTSGVFQLESDGMKNFIKQFQPNSFEELIALVGIYRPGPLHSGMAMNFVDRKHGRMPVQYNHPSLEPILNTTYGVIIYQEQVMLIAQSLAKFTLAEADILRRAMGKKKADELQSLRDKFLSGCAENKISQEIAVEIFSLIETFAGYGFNKSHSVAYGLISYQTAYLKTFFRLEFMAVLMSMHASDQSYIGKLIREGLDIGIKVTPPSINHSLVDFQPEKGSIRFGFVGIKNLSVSSAEAIINLRDTLGGFKSLESFYDNLDPSSITSRDIDALIKSGSLDDLYKDRLAHLKKFPEILAVIKNNALNINEDQLFLFDKKSMKLNLALKDDTNYFINYQTSINHQNFELSLLGHSFSVGPLGEYTCEVKHLKDVKNAISIFNLKNLLETTQNDSITKGKKYYFTKSAKQEELYYLTGNIKTIKLRYNKNNNPYTIVELEDKSGSIDLWLLEDAFNTYKFNITNNLPVYVIGSISRGSRLPSFSIKHIFPLAKIRKNHALGIRLNLSSFYEDDIKKIVALLKSVEAVEGMKSDDKLEQNVENDDKLEKFFDLIIPFKKHGASLKYRTTAKVVFDMEFCEKWRNMFARGSYQYIYRP